MYGCHYAGLRGVLRKMRTRLRLIIHNKAGLIHDVNMLQIVTHHK